MTPEAEDLRDPTPGKIGVVATTPLANQRDLALAYTPGVAAASLAIVADASSWRSRHGRARRRLRRCEGAYRYGRQAGGASVEDSVTALRRVIAGLRKADGGSFFNYGGSPIPW